MAIFITRVELHDVPRSESYKVYARLHIEMAKEHFYPAITKDGETYQLPSATYIHSEDSSNDVVIVDGFARMAAASLGYKCWTLTVKANSLKDIDWSDLPMLD